MSLTISPARIVEESNSPLLAAPEGWPRRPLGEVATILNGHAFKSKQFVIDGGVPLIRIRDIFNTETAVGYVGDYDQRYIVRKGELLVGMDGDFNCARWAGPDALLNQRVCKIEPDPDVLDLDYLTAVLPGYLQAIHDVTSSTTVTHLSSRDVAELPLPVPTLAEQRALAIASGAAMSSASSAITHLATARHAIERFRQAVLAAACTGRLTADWRDAAGVSDWDIERAADVCDKVQSGGTPRSGFTDEPDVPFLKVYNIVHHQVDFDYRPQYVPKTVHRTILKKSVAYPGDVIMNIVGPPLGKVAIIPDNFPEWNLNQAITIFRPGERILREWLYYFLRSGIFMDDDLVTRGSAGQSNISLTQCREIRLPVPTIAEQKLLIQRIAELMTFADSLLTRINAARRRVDRTPQAVLAKAFRGGFVTMGVGVAGD